MRTVLVAFGTHFRMTQEGVDAISAALSAALEARDDLQVLWKLVKHGNVRALGMSRWGGRVKLVDWLENEPMDIMRTGRIAALVHHGGSNSYHEALA
jgi:muconolactone delta-isomerase